MPPHLIECLTDGSAVAPSADTAVFLVLLLLVWPSGYHCTARRRLSLLGFLASALHRALTTRAVCAGWWTAALRSVSPASMTRSSTRASRCASTGVSPSIWTYVCCLRALVGPSWVGHAASLVLHCVFVARADCLAAGGLVLDAGRRHPAVHGAAGGGLSRVGRATVCFSAGRH